jgi:hypothetical protein
MYVAHPGQKCVKTNTKPDQGVFVVGFITLLETALPDLRSAATRFVEVE